MQTKQILLFFYVIHSIYNNIAAELDLKYMNKLAELHDDTISLDTSV